MFRTSYGQLPTEPSNEFPPTNRPSISHSHSNSFQYLDSPGLSADGRTPLHSRNASYSREASHSRGYSQSKSLRSARSSVFRFSGKAPSGFYDNWIRNWWLWELTCATIGTGLFVTLVVLLKRYDGQKTPHFGKLLGTSFTLNALVSLLSTFAKAFFIFTIAACLGQLKWIWYSKRFKVMHDLEVFDRASRGPYGGFGLLWTLKFRQIGSLGAILMILSVIIDPLAQQLVVYNSESLPDVDLPSNSAWVPVQTHWQEASTDVRTLANLALYDYISPTTKGSVLSGLYNGNQTIGHVWPHCENANCTWPIYQSLAVCWSWTDISDHLKFDNQSANDNERAEFWDLNAHKMLNAQSTVYFNLTSVAMNNQSLVPGIPLNFDQSIAYQGIANPIADVFVVYLDGNSSNEDAMDYHYKAMEIVFEWCVESFQTNVTNGNASTVTFNDKRGFDLPADQQSASLDPNSKMLQLQPDADGPMYSVDYQTHLTLQRYMFDTFRGQMQTPNHTTSQRQNWIWYSDTDSSQLLFEPYNVFQHQKAAGNAGQGQNATGMAIMLNNVATGLTNHVRQTNPTDTRYGQTLASYQVVLVRWGWFAGPLAFAGLSLIFLATTIIYQAVGVTAKGTWKTSTLSVLHAANPELQSLLQGMKYPSEMTRQSKRAYIRLVDEADGGWRLWAQKN